MVSTRHAHAVLSRAELRQCKRKPINMVALSTPQKAGYTNVECLLPEDTLGSQPLASGTGAACLKVSHPLDNSELSLPGPLCTYEQSGLSWSNRLL